jgi:hypothetical protein
MTPQEFYDGPVESINTLARAKAQLRRCPDTAQQWEAAATRVWERICRYCRRPSAKTCNIYEDLAELIAGVILFADRFVGEPDILKAAMDVMKPKMLDYAGEASFSANFERQAARAGLSPARVWCVFASKHWDAVSSFATRGRVESEPIAARLVDIVNYCQLLAGMVHEGIA